VSWTTLAAGEGDPVAVTQSADGTWTVETLPPTLDASGNVVERNDVAPCIRDEDSPNPPPRSYYHMPFRIRIRLKWRFSRVTLRLRPSAVGCCVLCVLLLGACHDDESVAPSAGPSHGIAITSPVAYQTYQRDGNGRADITISGTYADTPTAIEARFSGGGWSALDASPSAGSFSGTLSQQRGQGTLEVRFANDTTVMAAVRYVGIGDVFLVAGQSNASGRGNNNQGYTHASLKASMYREDGRWAELTDVTDSDDGLGSPWPLLATRHMADQGVPIAFVTAADGGTGLVAPDANWSKNGTQYRGLVNAINNSGINTAKAILWHQGERDARNSVDQAAYQTALSEMLDDLQGDLGGNFADLRLVCAQIGMSRLLDARQLDRVRLAQANRWDNDPDILAGPVLHDVDLSDGGGDGVHFRTDAELQTLTDRWWRALKYHFYGGTEPARGPRFGSATHNGYQTTITFTGGQGSLVNGTDVTGWAVTDANGTRTVLSASGTGDALTLTVDRVLVAPVLVTFGSGNTGAGATLRDSGTYPLPPEPFVGEPTKAPGSQPGRDFLTQPELIDRILTLLRRTATRPGRSRAPPSGWTSPSAVASA